MDELGWIVKLNDFGISKFFSDATNVVRGCVRNYAPEAQQKLTKDYYTYKGDVYMMAMAMHELYYQQKIFPNVRNSDVTELVKEGQRPTLTADLHPDYVDIMTQCWAQDPEDRPTAKQVVARIEKILNKM